MTDTLMATTGTPRRTDTGGGRGPTAPPTRPGKRRPARRKRSPFWQGVVTLFQALTLLVLVAGITFMVCFGLQLRNAPSSIDITFDPPGRTLIYSSDGTLLAKMYVENRQVVPISQIPKDLQNATIAFEDKRFYTHSGVDFQGILRALGRNIKSRDLHGEGGSTITQQLARNMGIEGLGREKTLGRKLHEMLVAAQIEKNYTKQDILEMYLNQVNYGSGAYGVQAAAQTYFGKDVKSLDLAQCALLAGLPNRPRDVSPYKDKDAAEAQRNRVLDNMFEQHYITAEQWTHAKAEYIHLAAPHPPKQGSQVYHAPFFVNYVADQLQHKYGKDYLERGNLRVYTTLSWPMQQIAEDALRQGIANVSGRGPNQGCLVALDPKTGEIKAMVGGTDYAKNQFNIVTQARRQPGSSFKAVVYSAAIDSHVVSENTTVLDAPVTYQTGGKAYTPRDDNGYSYRRRTLRDAMAQSVNVPAVKVLKEVGAQSVVRYARLMGVDSPLDPVLSLALGSSGVTPMEMADVYATIANGGNHPVPTPFTRLADSNDRTIEDIPPAIETHVLQPDTVRQVDDMLRAVVTDGTGKVVDDVPEARGKTGTTQGHKDVWFVGYDKNLVCAVWAGHPLHNAKTGQDSYGAEMEGNAWGSTVCAPIWRNFMLKAVPLFQAAEAKEAARSHPKAKPVVVPAIVVAPPPPADPFRGTRSERRRRRAEQRAQYGGDANSASPDTAPADTNSATDTAPPADTGTATPAAADASSGMSTPLSAPSADSAPAGSPSRAQRDPSSGASDGTNAGADTSSAPAPRRHARAHPSTDYVTVRINPEDGLRATQWTPEVVEKTYAKGAEPHRYSRMYAPPPGEH